jgi:aminomethyltransferase
VSLDGEREFEGRRALENAKNAVTRRLSCLRATERGVPRAGYAVMAADRRVGALTSGTFSPSLNTGIALAYLPAELAAPGTRLTVDVRGRPLPVEVGRRPFYRPASAQATA